MRYRRAALPILVLGTILPALAWADGSSDGGSTTGQLVAGLLNGCWTCGAFNTIGAIGLGFADAVFSQLADGMTILIGLFMALWVLFFAAKLFLPFGPPGSNHWNMGATKLLKLIFVLAFLQTSGPFWEYIFTPILSAGLGLASQLATAADGYEQTFGKSGDAPAGAVDYCKSPGADTQIPNLSDAAKQGLTALEQMDCPLSKMQSQFSKGILIGVAVIGQMGCQKSWLPHILPTEGAIASLVSGVILIGVFLFGFLTFPFLIIDVLARVILVAATSPLAIASILFKPTARIAERAMWSLLQAGMTLMFGAAIAGIGKALIAYILSQMSKNGGPALTNWQDLQNTLENSCSQNFNVDLSSANFYMLVGTGMVTVFMMRRASSLAGELTGITGSTGAQAGFAALAGAAGNAVSQGAQLAYREYEKHRKESKASQVTGNDKQ